MQYWAEPLDHTGSLTYRIDYTSRMVELNDSLSAVNVTLSPASISAGLVMTIPLVSNNIFTVKFAIPDPNNQIFTEKGEALDMQVEYVTALGERDSETFILLVRKK